MTEERAGPPPEEEAPAQEAPPPEYPEPPGYSPPHDVPASPRSDAPIIAAVAIIAVVAVFVYAVAGFAFASSRIDGTRAKYDDVLSHQNAITAEVNSFESNVTAVNLTSATEAELKLNRTAYETLVSQSRAAQPTIAADDASLAAAQATLNDNSWLTLFGRSSLNTASERMGHERKALATAKTITGDLILLGTFYQAFYDALIDLDRLSTKAQATDFTGATAAVSTLMKDLERAIQLSDAPGLPPEMKLFLTDFQTLAVDFGKLLNAAIAGDSNSAQANLTAVDADIAKFQAHDTDNMSNAIKGFYQPLIDTFNSEVAKANSM